MADAVIVIVACVCSLLSYFLGLWIGRVTKK
jgi:hypothetical protein